MAYDIESDIVDTCTIFLSMDGENSGVYPMTKWVIWGENPLVEVGLLTALLLLIGCGDRSHEVHHFGSLNGTKRYKFLHPKSHYIIYIGNV